MAIFSHDLPDNWKDVKAPVEKKPEIVNRYEMESDSTPGLVYEVAEWSDGTFSCNCPSWTRGRNQVGRSREARLPCKHVKRKMTELGKDI